VSGWTASPVTRGTLALFLALYLLLLAFFIMLLALSSLESRRTGAVMDSLTVTFSRNQTAPLTGPSQSIDTITSESRSTEAFIALVADLFGAALPTVRVRHLVAGQAIEMTMRGDSLFDAGSDTLRPVRVAMLDELVAALSSPPAGMRFEMAVLLQTGRPGTAASASNEERNTGALLPVSPDDLAVRRAAAMGRTMTERGAEPGSVLVGLAAGDPGWLSMTFRAVDAARWDPDFRGVPADAIAIDSPGDSPDSGPDAASNPRSDLDTGLAPDEGAFRGAQPGPAGVSVPGTETATPAAGAPSLDEAEPQRMQQ